MITSATLTCWAVGADAPVDATTAVFSPLEIEVAALSPDGQRLAYSRRETNGASVYVIDLNTKKAVRDRVADDYTVEWARESRHVRVKALQWSGDNFLLILIHRDEYPVDDVLAMHADGSDLRSLFNWRDPEWEDLKSLLSPTLNLVTPQPNESGFARVQIDKGPHEGARVYRFDLSTGKKLCLIQDDGPGRLLYDAAGGVRGKHDRSDIPQHYYYLPPGSRVNDWRALDKLVPRERAPEFIVTPESYFTPRSIPIGFGTNPRVLYYVSSVGRDTMGVYALNLENGKPEPPTIEDEAFDLTPFGPEPLLVFDSLTAKLAGVRYAKLKQTTRWLDPELAALQARIEEELPWHSMDIVDWDRERRRFLVRSYSRSDPGAFLIYARDEDKLVKIAERAPGLTKSHPEIHTLSWVQRASGGETLTGYLTLPARHSPTPPPIVVLFPAPVWSRASPNYEPEVRAFAQQGLAVLEVNYRGVPGCGLAHWIAGRDRPDEIAAEDVVAAVEAHAKKGVIDGRRVAVVGRDFGGYLALRTMQLHAGRFACGVIRSAPMDLQLWLKRFHGLGKWAQFTRETEAWFFGSDADKIKTHSPLYHPGPVGSPVMMIGRRSFDLSSDLRMFEMRNKMKQAGESPTFLDTSQLSVSDQSPEDGQVYAAIAEFLKKSFSAKTATAPSIK